MFYKFIGESYSGSIAVSKTVHGGSNPSSPVLVVLKALMMMWVFRTFVLQNMKKNWKISVL